MKTTGKSDLQLVATMLLVIAVSITVNFVVSFSAVRQLVQEPWHIDFTSESSHHHITEMIRLVFFYALPCIAILNYWAAWKVFRHANKGEVATSPT